MTQKNILKYISFIIAFFFLNTSVGLAADASHQEGVKQFVDKNAHNILSIIEKNNLSDSQKEKELSNIFMNVMDMDWMAKFALSSNWKTLPAAQQTKYLHAYKNYLTHIYVPKFKLYHQHTYHIGKIENLGNEQYLVSLSIETPNSSSPINVSYRLKSINGNSFKIRDIVIEGVSMLATQRSDFGATFNSGGIDKIIELLQSKKMDEKNESNEE